MPVKHMAVPAGALFELAKKANATGELPMLEQPGRNVFLGEQYVNNRTLSDVTFLVQVCELWWSLLLSAVAMHQSDVASASLLFTVQYQTC